MAKLRWETSTTQTKVFEGNKLIGEVVFLPEHGWVARNALGQWLHPEICQDRAEATRELHAHVNPQPCE